MVGIAALVVIVLTTAMVAFKLYRSLTPFIDIVCATGPIVLASMWSCRLEGTRRRAFSVKAAASITGRNSRPPAGSQ